jgi:hypothetical protein
VSANGANFGSRHAEGVMYANVCTVDHAKMLQIILACMIFLKFAICDTVSIMRKLLSTCKCSPSRPHPQFADRADGGSARVALIYLDLLNVGTSSKHPIIKVHNNFIIAAMNIKSKFR